ncbi:MAG: hypothetical protein KY432_09665, partial [Acidobacteria bacterium]|nr:hypothetical protein [Acidobacteriota bacterium]
DLHSNQLEELPDLGGLVLLEDLSLKYNRLRSFFELHENSLPSLTALDLSHNELTELPASLARLLLL